MTYKNEKVLVMESICWILLENFKPTLKSICNVLIEQKELKTTTKEKLIEIRESYNITAIDEFLKVAKELYFDDKKINKIFKKVGNIMDEYYKMGMNEKLKNGNNGSYEMFVANAILFKNLFSIGIKMGVLNRCDDTLIIKYFEMIDIIYQELYAKTTKAEEHWREISFFTTEYFKKSVRLFKKRLLF